MEEDFKKDGGSWKKFKIEDLFEVVGTKSLDEGKLTFLDEGINFVGRVNENNGIKGKIKKQNFIPNERFTITATVIGNYKYVKYQEEDYYCSQNINKLVPKFNINKNIALYIITFVKKFVEQYNGQQGGYKLDQLSSFEISLPVKKGEIAFDFMESYVSKLEEERVSKLEEERVTELTTYLKVSDLENYELNENEKKALNSLKNREIKISKRKISEVFELKSSAKKYNAIDVEFNGIYPYVTRGNSNNGIRGYITEDVKFLNEANTISFGQDTATMFYQENTYFTGDKIKILILKNKLLNKKIASFLITCMRKSFSIFSWGKSSFSEEVINSTVINLPINEKNEIDYTFMETYIKAIEKLSIKSLIEYKDEIIKSTKEIIKERNKND